MTEHFKAPEKIQLSEEEIASISDAQFKTLVIRMLTKLVEYGRKIEEKVKAIKSEIKENVLEPTGTGRNQDSNQWFGTEGRNKNFKNEERLRNLQDNFKRNKI